MGTKEELAYLEDERQKLWEEVTALKVKIKGIQKQTPDEVQSVLDKAAQIDKMSSTIETMYNTAVVQGQQINSSVTALDEAVTEVQATKENINSIYSESYELHIKATSNSTELINLSERSKEIKASLDTVLSEIKTKGEALTELNEIFETATDTEEKINLIHTNTDKYHKEVRSLHTKIFGYTKENEDGTKSRVLGMKDELENSFNNLKTELNELNSEIESALQLSVKNSGEVQEHWESEHSSLKDKIEALLPGALTAGLSYAYKEKKDLEITTMNEANKNFFYAILGLVLISLIPFGVSTYMLTNASLLEEVLLKLPRMVMAILPLYVPALWLAYSLSKKVNLSKRLIEEYAHKEALSKTFEGLSGQINSLKDGSEKDELKARLLYNLLEVSAENPGKLIYDYNNADHPLMDALDKSVKLSEAITKISNIPGISKLSNVLVEKERKIKADMDEKAEEGLEISKDVVHSQTESK